jgi:hypothetical protein
MERQLDDVAVKFQAIDAKQARRLAQAMLAAMLKEAHLSYRQIFTIATGITAIDMLNVMVNTQAVRDGMTTKEEWLENLSKNFDLGMANG